jgi:hypothetical protein
MNEGQKAGWWAFAYLCLALFTLLFTFGALVWHYLRQFFM